MQQQQRRRVSRNGTSSASEQMLQHLRETVYTRLQPSTIAGVGVFTVRDIPKGINPFRTVRPLHTATVDLTLEQVATLDPGVQKIVQDFLHPDSQNLHSVVANRRLHPDTRNTSQTVPVPINGLNSMDMSFYLNHSLRPNMVAVNTSNNAFMEFIALRSIPAGQELTIDYNRYND